MKRTKIEQLFENYSFWRHLSEEEKKMLQEQIRWCTYEEGQMVTDTGRDCLGIFLVCDGILRANLVSEAGKEATVCRIHPGELCVISASCLLPALPFDIQIDAETASEVYLLPTVSCDRSWKRISIWRTLSIKRSMRVFLILSPRYRKFCLPVWSSVWSDFFWMRRPEKKTERFI